MKCWRWRLLFHMVLWGILLTGLLLSFQGRQGFIATATEGAQGPAQGRSMPGKVVRPSDFASASVPSFPEELLALPELGDFPEEILELLKNNPPILDGKQPAHVEDPRDQSDSPRLVSDFKGIHNPQVFPVPPDPIAAVGPDHVVEMVNWYWQAFDKRGDPVTSLIPLCGEEGWWSPVFQEDPTKKPACSDPKILYDQFSNRWVMVMLGFTVKPFGVSLLLMAASHTSDPTGKWCVWTLDGTKNGEEVTETFADYPGLGVDKQAIYITTNQFQILRGVPARFAYAKIRVLDKKQLYSNSCESLMWTDFWNLKNPDGSSAATVQPAHTYEESQAEYLINSVIDRSGRGETVTLWTLASPLEDPRLSRTEVSVGGYANPPDAQQCKIKERLDTIDTRFYNAVFRETLWAAHTIACPSDKSKACIRLLQIDPEGATGPRVLDDLSYGAPSKDFSYFFPVITLDEDMNLYMVFNTSSTSECADIRFAGRRQAGLSNTLSSSRLLKSSNTEYNPQHPRMKEKKRWGDYNGIGLDPQTGTVWVTAEYAATSTKWGTWLGEITFERATFQDPIFLETDLGCGSSGLSYQLGETIEVTYAVNEDAAVTLYRLGHGPILEVLSPTRRISGGIRQTFPPFPAERPGVETVVLQAETVAGRVLTKACTYSVGGVSLEKARLSLDRGCDAVYSIGEPIIVSLFVEEASDVSVVDFATDGSTNTIVQQFMRAGETVAIDAQVVGPPGIDTLVMVAQTTSGLTVTSACSLTIE